MQNDTLYSAETQSKDLAEGEDTTIVRCGNCIGCFRGIDCRKCDNCLKNIQPCYKRICVQFGLPNNDLKLDINILPPITKESTRKRSRSSLPKPFKMEKKWGRPPKQGGAKRNITKLKQPKEPKPRKKYIRKSEALTPQLQASRSGFSVTNNGLPRHCLGPQCANAARQDSKYCSHECGLALAEQRIAVVLPKRLKEYYAEKPAAEVTADERLLDLIQKRKEVEESLQKANEYRENFDCYIKALADKTPATCTNTSNKKLATGDVVTCFCFVCGSEIPVSGSVQHTRRCFERLEKQSSFGTAHKVLVNPFQILCETHDKQTKTYCKRLRVVCPEHYKDDIGKQMKICGFPLAWEKLNLKNLEEMLGKNSIFTDGMCSLSRNKCVEHKMWEQNVAALIDNLRMSYLLLIDELVETYKRIIVATQSHYNGLLHLLSKTSSNITDSPTEEQDAVHVDVIIENETPTESQLAEMHLY